MGDLLRGNFETKKKVSLSETTKKETLEERFEREALKRLGGSICFVSKQKVMWELNDPKAEK